jgi:hypothetical protein
VQMVDVLHAHLWQDPHVQADLYSTFDIREGGYPLSPQIRGPA